MKNKLILAIIAIFLFSIFGLQTKNRIKTQIDSLISFGAEISSSQHSKAISILDSALQLSIVHSYPQGEAEALRKKGLAWFYAINYDEALKLFLESKKKFEELKDTIGITKANNMIAISYSYHGLNEQSLKIHMDNLEIQKKINDIEGISSSYNNIGVELWSLNRPEEALVYYQKAMALEKNLNDSISLSRYCDNIGSLLLELGHKDSALIYIKKALEIRNKINDLQGIKGSLESLGDYYTSNKEYLLAENVQEKSLEYAYKIGIVYEIASITRKLSMTYEKLGKFKDAFQTLLVYTEMVDSIDANETNDRLTKLEINKALETEKKIRQLLIENNEMEKNIEKSKRKNLLYILIIVSVSFIIIILFVWINLKNKKKHNQELMQKQEEIISQNEEIRAQHEAISEQNELLSKLNSEKDKFFSIIAHDLKSPFSGFLGLSKELAENYQYFDPEDIKEYAVSLQESASNLYKLLENLLEWSRIQRGVTQFNPDTCNMNFIVKQNINIQTEVAKQKEITLLNNVTDNTYAQVDVPMINTVIRNLMSNSIKFTPRGGKIEVNATPCINDVGKDCIKISINDNGIGMNSSIKDNLFKIDKKVSRPGTENEPSTGLGLLLCKEFIEKHGGDIWVESEEDKGSSFFFTIPAVG
jgi:signal transduction histidine kinase/tetratricopeptide (TPR) repeat protein